MAKIIVTDQEDKEHIFEGELEITAYRTEYMIEERILCISREGKEIAEFRSPKHVKIQES